jgi:hypothetical protein
VQDIVSEPHRREVARKRASLGSLLADTLVYEVAPILDEFALCARHYLAKLCIENERSGLVCF